MNLNRIIHKYLEVRPGHIPPLTSRKRLGRNDLIEIFKIAGYKRGAEIGVNKGDHSKMICDMIPDVELFCIDPWKSYYANDSQRRHDEAYRQAKEKLHDYNTTFIINTSIEAAKTIPDKWLDFVHIDGDHRFDSCVSDLIAWAPKVKIGGIISGHDYVHHYHFGVIEAVNAYIRAHNISPWYIIKGRQNTYFWVKKHED